MSDDFRVLDNQSEERFQIHDEEGELAGFIAYSVVERDGQQVWDLSKIFIFPEYQGRGLAARLTRHVLDDIKNKGARVIPTCPYIASWIERNSEYKPLVWLRARRTLSPES